MKPECEGGGSGPRIPDFVSGEQVSAEGLFACLLVEARQVGESGSGPARAFDRYRYRPD